MARKAAHQILVIDCGSQYTQIIKRQMYEQNIFPVVLPPRAVAGWLERNTPKGIIISGGEASITDEDAPRPPRIIFNLNIPILGICFGMHWMADTLGGVVQSHLGSREYGPAEMRIDKENESLFRDVPHTSTVWESHGDSTMILPRKFLHIASTNDNWHGAMRSENGLWWGVQWHPEVMETEYGQQMIKNFLTVCRVIPDWKPENKIEQIQRETLRRLPYGERCLLACSGGVDSSTLAAILQPILKERLVCVTIDTGALREHDLEEALTNSEAAGCKITVLDCKARFIAALSRGRDTDAEKKRKRFQKEYRFVLEEFALARGIRYLAQGTLAPDVIESGKIGKAAKIKTHHNKFKSKILKQLHPFRELFKDEVRLLAESLGMPFAEREPFPGPGLFIRIVGLRIQEEYLNLVRWADAQVRNVIADFPGLADQFDQLVVALLGIRTVGIKGDGRSYAYPIVIRAICTRDFMTGHGYCFSEQVQGEIQKVLTKHPLINRVFFDTTNKPPGTTEFE